MTGGGGQSGGPGPLPIGEGERVFVLTGAGISAESGIRTFRDSNGLWEEHRVEDVATPEGFEADPRLVWRFYSERRRQALACRPNQAHLALGRLEQRLGERLTLGTQNVDHLHELGGSGAPVHMHGELFVTRCSTCERAPFRDESLWLERLPSCERCGGLLRPHIVWFGEVPFALERLFAALEECDLFVTIGSSGAVYPAAGFVRALRQTSRGRRARAVYVGLERPANAGDFDDVLLGKAGELVPRLFGDG
jgi:NAD-dependent deacetylase